MPYGAPMMAPGMPGPGMPPPPAVRPEGGRPAPAPAPAAGGDARPPLVLANQAQVIVSLPADAKLFIDDQPTVSTSANRTFVSPTLDAGKDYYYTLKAEVVRDGQPVSVYRQLTVRAGETVQATFQFPTTVAAN